MAFVILGFIIAVFVFLYSAYKTHDFDGAAISISFFVGFLGAAAGLVLALVIGATFPPREYDINVTSKELVSIVDQTTINGRSYFMGSGIINEKMTYFAYYKDSQGFKVQKSYADHSIIRYTDSQPKIEYHTKVYRKYPKSYRYFGINVDHPRHDFITYVYYVPEGSIQNHFTLDL